MKLIGYKLKYQYHNGDSCEWSRIITMESDIFLTKEAAMKSIELIKKRKIEEARNSNSSYISFQYDCEVSHGRSTNKLLCEAREQLMKSYKRIFRLMRKFEIVPIYAREIPISDLNHFELAN